MRKGYKLCRICGEEENVADMVSGCCPVCARYHAQKLSEYQRQYESAVAAGEPDAVSRVSELIAEYEQSERVRLKDAHREHSPGVKAK